MTDLIELAALFDVEKGPGEVLRFEEAIVAGKRGYAWGGVQTGSVEAMRLMNAAWNNRRVIAGALRARAHLMERSQ